MAESWYVFRLLSKSKVPTSYVQHSGVDTSGVKMEIAFWAATDIGRVREHNEDNFLVDKRLRLFVVCDGMGGHAAGEVASAMSVRIVREVVSAQREVIEQINTSPDNAELRQFILGQLEFAVQEANRRVFESSREDESRRGMGTTCCVLLLTNKTAFIAHVGDSRIYLLRQQQVHQLTEDHSLYNEMVRLGKIRAGDPINLPNKNAVTRAVGVREVVEIDTIEFEVMEQDRFLVCSDGLCGYFKADEQIKMMLSAGDAKDVTELSIAFALESGGKDNVTAIIVDVVKQNKVDSPHQTLEATLEGIKHVPYFQYLNHKEKMRVLNLAQTVKIAPDTNLFSIEAQDSWLCIILEGQVELRRDGRVLDTLDVGGYTGEVGFIDGQPNDFEAVTTQDSVIIAFSRRQFMELLRQSPELAVKLMWNFLQMFTIRVRELSIPAIALSVMEESMPELNTMDRRDELVKTMTMPQMTAMDEPLPSMDPKTTIPLAVEGAPKVVVPGDSSISLSETTEAPYDDSAHEEDLRATMQLEWDSTGELLKAPSLNANDDDSNPPPVPFGAKMPPLPPRKQKEVPALSRGISGVSKTHTVEMDAAQIEKEPVQAPVQTPVEEQAIPASLPPMAAVMKRTAKRRQNDEVVRDERPLISHGLHSSSEAMADRADLITTVQLDLNDLDFDDEESPTKQLNREGLSSLVNHKPAPKITIPKIKIGDDS